MISSPLVSIGLSVYNCQATIGSTVRSILNQTYENWELILIDDGSRDDTLTIVKQFKDDRIRIHSDGRNRGLPGRLNEAVALSRGKYFARLDGDDICYPTRLASQVDFLEKNPDIDLIGSRVLIFKDNGLIVGTYPFYEKHSEICRRPWSGFYLPHPTWMGKGRWFRENPYCTKANRMEDQELLLRTFHHSRFYCLPEFLLGYRQTYPSLKRIVTGRYNFILFLFKKSIRELNIVYLWGSMGQIETAPWSSANL